MLENPDLMGKGEGHPSFAKIPRGEMREPKEPEWSIVGTCDQQPNCGVGSADRVNSAQSTFCLARRFGNLQLESSRDVVKNLAVAQHPPVKRALNPIVTHESPEPTHFDGCGNVELEFVVLSSGNCGPVMAR